MDQKLSAPRWLRSATLGGVLAMVVSAALCMGAAALIVNGALPLEASASIAIMICLLSSWVGAFVGAKRAGERRMPAALCACAVYLLELLAVKGLAYRGGFSQAAYLLAAVAVGGVSAGLMAAKRKRRRR